MKRHILFISPYNPFVPRSGAASKSVRHRLQSLCRKARVTLVTFGAAAECEGKAAENLNIDGRFVEALPHREEGRGRVRGLAKILCGRLTIFEQAERMVQRLLPLAMRVIEKGNTDLVHVEDVLISAILDYLPKEIPNVVFFHNLLTLQYYRLYRSREMIFQRIPAAFEYLWIKRFEQSALRKLTTTVVLTEVEREKAIELCPSTKVYQIPLEVDINEYEPGMVESEELSIAFTGTMSYYPNSEAVVHFMKNIFPLIVKRFPMVKFYVVGRNPGREIMCFNSDRVVITGEVKSIQSFLRKANVVVVPLVNGGGMRLKILEAFALSKAVVSTPLGAEGIEYVDGENIFIATDAKTFAEKVCYLLGNRELAEAVGAKARALVEGKYSIEKVWKRWEGVYGGLLGNFE